ncbi:MAG: ABATE domain-containing protein [Aliidongia sp.]
MNDDRPPPIFIADARGLDFLNSVATPTDAQVEWLPSGDDLVKWLVHAGMVPAEVPALFGKNAVPGELDAVAAKARALREWFRSFVYRHKGAPLGASALEQLEPLNQVLARDEEFGEIVARAPSGDLRHDDGHDHVHSDETRLPGFVLRQRRRWRSPDTLLLPIARAMADLICDDDFSRVKACEGASCTLVFIDRTRRRTRRWCSMALCGNRAKQQAHRDRIKST